MVLPTRPGGRAPLNLAVAGDRHRLQQGDALNRYKTTARRGIDGIRRCPAGTVAALRKSAEEL